MVPYGESYMYKRLIKEVINFQAKHYPLQFQIRLLYEEFINQARHLTIVRHLYTVQGVLFKQITNFVFQYMLLESGINV